MDPNQPEKYHRYRRYFVDISRFYQKKKARVYTGIVLSILAVAFFLFFAIRPTLVTITSLLKEIKDKREIAEQLEDKINALNSAQIEYQRIEKDLYLIDESLPVNADVSLLLRQLEALARKNNVALGPIQFEETILKGEEVTPANKTKKKTEVGEAAQSVNFSLAVAGNYNQLKSFLGALTRLRRLVLVDAFAFQTGKKEEGLVLSLNAKAYYLIKEQ